MPQWNSGHGDPRTPRPSDHPIPRLQQDAEEEDRQHHPARASGGRPGRLRERSHRQPEREQRRPEPARGLVVEIPEPHRQRLHRRYVPDELHDRRDRERDDRPRPATSRSPESVVGRIARARIALGRHPARLRSFQPSPARTQAKCVRPRSAAAPVWTSVTRSSARSATPHTPIACRRCSLIGDRLSFVDPDLARPELPCTSTIETTSRSGTPRDERARSPRGPRRAAKNSVGAGSLALLTLGESLRPSASAGSGGTR